MFQTFITPHEFIDDKDLTDQIKKELKEAEVSKSSLEVLWEPDNVDYLLELIKGYDLIIPMTSSHDVKEEEEKFLIPSMLTSEKCLQKMTKGKERYPLALDTKHEPTFGESLPLGLFPRFLARCSKIRDWVLHSISSNDGSFEIHKDVLLSLTLDKKSTGVHASIRCESDISKVKPEVLLEIKKTLEASMMSFNLKATVSFEMICPSCKLEKLVNEGSIITMKETVDPQNPQNTTYQFQEECGNYHKLEMKREEPGLPETEFGNAQLALAV